MWATRIERLDDRRGLRVTVTLQGRSASFAEVLNGWQLDAEFRKLFNSLLANASFDAFRWETPCVTAATRARSFEFVLLDSPGLAHRPDVEAFAEHFRNSDESIVTVPNLGGDAILIIPVPIAEPSAYGHLAAFTRLAPSDQQDELWKRVGATLSRRIGPKAVWLSTAGAGVSWLHVRLDDRPKYYGYDPYRQIAK